MTSSTKVMGRRVVAYIIDALLISAINLGVFFLFAEKDTDVARGLQSGEFSPDDTTYGNITIGDNEWSIVGGTFLLYLLIVFAIAILVFWVLQGLTGWTPGKLVTGIRTVKEDGNAPGVGKAAVRWLLWIVDGFPYFIFGLVGFIVAMTSDLRQRVGDKLAGTYVVKSEAMGQPVASTASAAMRGAAPGPPAAPSSPPPAPPPPSQAGS